MTKPPQRGDPRRKLHKVPARTRQTWRRHRRRWRRRRRVRQHSWRSWNRCRCGRRRRTPPRTGSNQGVRYAQTGQRRPEVDEPGHDGPALVQLDRLRGGRRRGRGLRRRTASHMRNLHLGGLYRCALPQPSSSSSSFGFVSQSQFRSRPTAAAAAAVGVGRLHKASFDFSSAASEK